MRKVHLAHRTCPIDDTFRTATRLVPALFIRDALARGATREDGMAAWRAAQRTSVASAANAPKRNRETQTKTERSMVLFDDFCCREQHVDPQFGLFALPHGFVFGKGSLQLAKNGSGEYVTIDEATVCSYIAASSSSSRRSICPISSFRVRGVLGSYCNP